MGIPSLLIYITVTSEEIFFPKAETLSEFQKASHVCNYIPGVGDHNFHVPDPQVSLSIYSRRTKRHKMKSEMPSLSLALSYFVRLK